LGAFICGVLLLLAGVVLVSDDDEHAISSDKKTAHRILVTELSSRFVCR